MKTVISAIVLLMSCHESRAVPATIAVDWDNLILGENFELNREELAMFIDDPSIGKLKRLLLFLHKILRRISMKRVIRVFKIKIIIKNRIADF